MARCSPLVTWQVRDHRGGKVGRTLEVQHRVAPSSLVRNDKKYRKFYAVLFTYFVLDNQEVDIVIRHGNQSVEMLEQLGAKKSQRKTGSCSKSVWMPESEQILLLGGGFTIWLLKKTGDAARQIDLFRTEITSDFANTWWK